METKKDAEQFAPLALGFNLRNKLKLLPTLAQISEDPEDSEIESESPYSFISPSPMIVHQPEEPKRTESPEDRKLRYRAGYFLSVLHKLQDYSGVLNYVLSEAVARQVLGRNSLDKHQYYDEFIRTSPKPIRLQKERSQSLSSRHSPASRPEPTPRLPAIKLTRSLMGATPTIVEQDEIDEAAQRTKRREANKTLDFGESLRNVPKPTTRESSRDDSYSSPSSGRSRSTSRYTSSRGSRRGGLKAPPRFVPNAESVLAQNKEQLQSIFRRICRASDSSELRGLKATPDDFAAYLSLRYPPHITSVLTDFFKLTDTKTFHAYQTDMEKCLNVREDRVQRLAFECFDFNQDKYICSKDAFAAIAARVVDCYDHDLVKIKGMFAMKRNRMVPTKKGRGMSRAGTRAGTRAGSDSTESSARKRMPHYHPTKPEAITLADFQRIEFHGGKSQLVLDVFAYLTSLNLQDFNPFGFGFAGPEDRPPSEDLIAESYLSREAEQQLQSDPRIDYYNELVMITQTAAMNLFPSDLCSTLLSKFNTLRCMDLVNAIISEQSIVYYVLSGVKNQDVTKPLFLRTFHKFLNGNETVTSRFVFSIYATRLGNELFQDDVNSMLEDLPLESPIYHECMKLVDLFVSSAIDKNQEPLEFINYKLFCDILPESLFVEELKASFTCPPNTARLNHAFTPLRKAEVAKAHPLDSDYSKPPDEVPAAL